MDSRQPDLLKPTLISGLVFGIAAGIPFVNFLNCLCCALIWGCGLFAAYLYAGSSRAAGVAFRPGNGAMVGLLAGAFYAVAVTVIDTLVSVMFGPAIMQAMQNAVSRMPGVPPEALDAIERFSADAGTVSVIGLVLRFLLNAFMGAVFSTLGGLLGGALFKHEPPPPPPVTPPAPPSAPAWGGPDPV